MTFDRVLQTLICFRYFVKHDPTSLLFLFSQRMLMNIVWLVWPPRPEHHLILFHKIFWTKFLEGALVSWLSHWILENLLYSSMLRNLGMIPKWLFTSAILCLAIDILEYVFNWLERQGQTAANHKRMSCSIDYHEFVTYTRMTIATSKTHLWSMHYLWMSFYLVNSEKFSALAHGGNYTRVLSS